jgi:hypothetical protein
MLRARTSAAMRFVSSVLGKRTVAFALPWGRGLGLPEPPTKDNRVVGLIGSFEVVPEVLRGDPVGGCKGEEAIRGAKARGAADLLAVPPG